MVISDLWCYYCKKTTACWRLRWFFFFLAIECYLIEVYALLFKYNALVHVRDYSVNITFICTGKQKCSRDLLYCNICFIVNLQYLWGACIFFDLFDDTSFSPHSLLTLNGLIYEVIILWEVKDSTLYTLTSNFWPRSIF